MADMQSQIKMTADATGVETGVARAKRSIRDLGNTAQAEGKKAAAGLENIGAGSGKAATKVESATRSLIGSIQRTTAAMEAGSKSSADYYRALAQQRGISTQTLEPYLKQLELVTAKQKAAQTALTAGNAVLDKTGISAKQTAAALRGVPAQFTDIAVSLQGGQNPLTVLLQQGGQLKDMFGGIGPAARALGGYVIGLVNPFTVTAAAVAALALAYKQGSDEADEYRKSLVLTGNVAGTTTRQMQIMAQNIDLVVGTQHQAAEALAAVASTGLVAGRDLQKFGETAVRIQRTLGTSVQDTAKQFEALGREPLRASEKLNESMNYLTLSVYDQIRALQDQGREAEAASVAQNAYADAMNQRTAKLDANLGIIQRAWRAVADAALEGWDQILGIGRPDGPGDAAMPRWGAAGLLTLANPAVGVGFGAGEVGRFLRGKLGDALTSDVEREANAETQRLVARASTTAAEIERTRASTQKAGIAASQENAKWAERALSDTQRLNKELERYRQNNEKINAARRQEGRAPISAEQIKREEDAIRESVLGKPKKGRAPRAYTDDAATRMLETLKQSEASLKEQLSTDEKLTASERERAKFVQLIADLKDKKQLTAEQKSLLASKDQILAQLDINVALEKQIQAKEKARKLDEEAKRNAEEFKRQIEAINLSIQSTAQSRADQYDRSLSAFGLGSRAREQVEAQKSIFREFERYQLQLNKQAAEKNQLGSDEYKAESQRIKDALNDALKAQEDYFAALKEKQSDWKNGANEALADYIDRIDNAAERARDAITESLDGLTGSLTDALMGEGSGSWEDLGKNIARRLLKGFVETEITKPLAQFLQQSLNDGSSGVGSILGSLFGGKGSGALASLLGVKDVASTASTASAATAQASVAASATAATTSLTALAAAAATAAASMGGTSLAGALGIANSIGASGGDALGSLISAMGWADGGYTGAGGKYQPAGIVHAGEYVINADSTRRLGLNLLDKLNRRGFADGGFVNPAAIMGGDLRGPSNSTTQNINIHNHFAAGTSRETVDQAVLRMSRALQKAGRNA